MSFGAPLEERVGGDYGPEYYRALQAQRHRKNETRASAHCRTTLVETRSGPRRVRRCS
jgi:hypothetical protein